jgi:uncharacterized protein YecE (DUF72 family)
MAVHDILFGVAGWSYEDWKGRVYPRDCKDTLRFVAEKVDLIEINNTFYRPPVARHCAAWVERTADLGTRFTAKLPREFTHLDSTDAALAAQVREGLAPLLESGRLLGLLAQFNWKLEADAASFQRLRFLAAEFGRDTQLVVEVRHRSWNAPQALAALADLGVSVANLDYPAMSSGFSRDVSGVNGSDGLAYFRLHGRNRATWFDKDSGRDETYDWEYPAREVRQIEERLRRIAGAAARTLVVANNHFHGKAMKLIEELLAWYRAGGARQTGSA